MSNKFLDLKELLDKKAEQYNCPAFIPDDPISVPHQFNKKQDIEIMGFFAAMLAWGQRKTIIRKCNELAHLMEGMPHDFILNHREKDLKKFLQFKHRTFHATDLLYFLSFLKYFYRKHDTLEDAFVRFISPGEVNIENAFIGFHKLFFSLEHVPDRTRKHIATPFRKSACKRMNMFLRWMVRRDDKGVDFGLWKRIQPSQLICPVDLHVERVARKLQLVTRKQTDWQAALELTENLKKLDPNDPVKYDFALFGLGVVEKM